MKYKVFKDKIEIEGKDNFNIAHILECGQIFNYEKIDEIYYVYSKDKLAKVTETLTGFIIETDAPNYFENFFDLTTDYSQIKNSLKKRYDFLDKAIDFGYGIRILKQEPIEMIISFIISANNNIPRIKKSIKGICEKFGKNMGNYFAFPTITELLKATQDDFKALGLGYRAPQMIKAIKQIQKINIEELQKMTTQNAIQELLKLSGVGPKVADCIMLFGMQNKYVFPVDTWIEKVYNKYFTQNPQTNRKIIREKLTQEFGALSGYAQQYLFYYQRSGN